MGDRPVDPPENLDLMKLQNRLDCAEHGAILLDSERYYDCIEDFDNQNNQNNATELTTTVNLATPEETMSGCTSNLNYLTQSTEPEEKSDERKMESKQENVVSCDRCDEQELSEVLRKLLEYGEQIRVCALQAGVNEEGVHYVPPECTGTEPCLEPFITSTETLEPKASGDAVGGLDQDEENGVVTSTVTCLYGTPGEEFWCTPSCSNSVTRTRTSLKHIDTTQNLRLDSLEDYFRELIYGLAWPKNEEEEETEAQVSSSKDKQEYRNVKKSKSDSEVLVFNSQDQKQEDESSQEECETDSNEKEEKSSSEWSTLSCHTISSQPDGEEDRSTNLDGTQDDAFDDDDDDFFSELEGRPDASGDCESPMSVPETEEERDEGVYDLDDDDHIYVSADSGDQDSLDSAIIYGINLLTEAEENTGPAGVALNTGQMLDELFPNTRLQPRPIRILQSLPDHPNAENTSGGGEGDYELGRRMMVQSFFIEDTATEQEENDNSSWSNIGISHGSVPEVLRWTAFAGVCVSAILIWKYHHCFH